ncbi:unnamed protein product [Calypogeia fissa]
MEIHVAENGQSFGLDCQPTSTIEMLQNILAPVTGMPVHDQMLICGDTRLEPHRNLMFYKLPDEGRHVFLFNRSRLIADSPCPPPEEFEPITAVLPAPPSSASTESHPLDEASDPALKALPSYEAQFKYHYQKGLAILNASQRKFDACRRLLREQQVQELALETARGNMDFYYKIIDNVYSDFIKQYNRQHKQHSELLANLERDLERLRSCRLHPGLRSQHRETLLDCVKEGRVRKWAEHCSISFKQFNGKVADLKEAYADLQRKVQYLFYTAPAVNVRDLVETIGDSARYTEDQASIIQSLSKDVNTVKKLVDDCVSSQFSASLRPHDAVSALGPMYEVHDKSHIPRMEANDREVGKLLQYCQKSKNDMSRDVHIRLRSVAALQSNLKDMRNQLAVFKEAVNRQEEIFTELRIVRRTGSAYKACLAEASRRKAFMKLYMGQAGQLAENLARKRETEVSRREEFLKAQSVYFSRELLEAMGLYENPSQCVVNIAPFDTNLVDVEVADLDRYAPESLVGPLLKISGLIGRGRGGQGISDSEFQGGAERDNFDAEDEDGGNSEEISGTSKLEVENAWLKGELASAVAKLCQVDPETESEEAGEIEHSTRDGSSHHRINSVQKTADALRLKDDYAKHLHDLLYMKQSQCQKYEKRIRELEQRLSDQHLQMQKIASADNDHCSLDRAHQDAHSEPSDVTSLRIMSLPEPMDEEVSSAGVHGNSQLEQSNRDEAEAETGRTQSGQCEEVTIDKTASDISESASALDTASRDFSKQETGSGVHEEHEEIVLDGLPGVAEVVNANEESTRESDSGIVAEQPSREDDAHRAEFVMQERDEQVEALQKALQEKTAEYAELEDRLQAALAESCQIHTKLDSNAELLSECQLNCAHLENRLHEAREQARVNLCAAERRATEYNALRSSSVRLRGLMERLRSLIASSDDPNFEESLQALVTSLSSPSPSDSGEDVQFRMFIKILAEKFGVLAQERTELLERCTIAENNQQMWISRFRRSRDFA